MKQFTPAAGMMLAVTLVVILGTASVVGMADAGQNPASPSPSATPSAAASPVELAVMPSESVPSESAESPSPSPTGSPAGSPTMWPITTPPRPSDTPTPFATDTPKPKPTPVPYRDTVWNARTYAKNRLGAGQYGCLDSIFNYESKWSPTAGRVTGPYGIPQANPGSKMAAFGSNWRYSPLTQVKWGIWYVTNRYGSACVAWDHIQGTGWY